MIHESIYNFQAICTEKYRKICKSIFFFELLALDYGCHKGFLRDLNSTFPRINTQLSKNIKCPKQPISEHDLLEIICLFVKNMPLEILTFLFLMCAY